MRAGASLACVVVTAAACSFHPGEVATDAPGSGSGHPGTGADAGGDAPGCTPRLGSACGGKLWETDFSSDPTKLDLNCDGVADWALRDGSAYPTAQLGSDGWQAPAPSQPLDTQPRQPFTTRVVIDVAMQSTQMPSPGSYGAVFWINVDYDAAGAFAVVFADLALQADTTQTLTLYSKNAAGVAYSLSQVSLLPQGSIPLHLDIDPTALQVHYDLDDGMTSGNASIQQIGSGSTDQWATVVAYSAAASFQSVRVEVCQP